MNNRTKYNQHLIKAEGFPPMFAEQFIQQFESMSFAQLLRFDSKESLGAVIKDNILHLTVSLYVFEGRVLLWMN